MTDTPTVSRRAVLGAAGAGAAGATLLTRPAAAATGPTLWSQPAHAGVPEVHGVHLQFGADAAREVVVSWITPQSVARPRVLLGPAGEEFGRSVPAETVTYTDAAARTEVFIHHARLRNLRPDTEYGYAAVHEGTTPIPGSFRTAPAGRAPFVFTSFGDQGTPTMGKQITPAGSTSPIWVNDNLGSPAGADTVTGIERIAPLFHLVNGDLCYANLATDRIRTWSDWFLNNSRSARFRPWMPAAGNHENELGNGPIGYGAYQSYFSVPSNNGDAETRGLWYAFTVGSVRVVIGRSPRRPRSGPAVRMSGFGSLRAGEHERRVVAAERERVGQHGSHVHLAGFVGDDVELQLRVGVVQVDRRRHQSAGDRLDRGDGLKHAPCGRD